MSKKQVKQVKLVEMWGVWMAMDTAGELLSPLPLFCETQDEATAQLDGDFVRASKMLAVDTNYFFYLPSPVFMKIHAGEVRQHVKMLPGAINEAVEGACKDFIKGFPAKLQQEVMSWWKYHYLAALRDPSTIRLEEDPAITIVGGKVK